MRPLLTDVGSRREEGSRYARRPTRTRPARRAEHALTAATGPSSVSRRTEQPSGKPKPSPPEMYRSGKAGPSEIIGRWHRSSPMRRRLRPIKQPKPLTLVSSSWRGFWLFGPSHSWGQQLHRVANGPSSSDRPVSPLHESRHSRGMVAGVVRLGPRKHALLYLTKTGGSTVGR